MRSRLLIALHGASIWDRVVGDDFPHCGSTEVVAAPEMAGTLSPYLPSVPQYSFWSVPGDPEGLVYRASSEAATPHAGRNFPVLVVVIAEMTESLLYYLP